jgi:hypothetical protein
MYVFIGHFLCILYTVICELIGWRERRCLVLLWLVIWGLRRERTRWLKKRQLLLRYIFVCVYIYIYIYMYVDVYSYSYIYEYVQMYIYTLYKSTLGAKDEHDCEKITLYTSDKHVCVYICVWTKAWIYVYVNMRILIHIFIYLLTTEYSSCQRRT